MDFDLFECPDCGGHCITPSLAPVCQVCGAPMRVVTDLDVRKQYESEILEDLVRLLGGDD